jgi:Spy/CpxP family protein refolding chaperone
MRAFKWVTGIACVVIGGSVIAWAADDKPPKADAPAKSDKSSFAPKAKIPAKYAALDDLTDDQKAKILAIHEKALAEIHDIQKKEDAESEALLTPAQIDEIKANESKNKVDKKASQMEARAKTEEEKAKELRDKADAATKPTDN